MRKIYKTLFIIGILTLLSGCSESKPSYDASINNKEPIKLFSKNEIEEMKQKDMEENKNNTTIQESDEDILSGNYREKLNDTPAIVKKIFRKNDTTYLRIDIVKQNPNFTLGDGPGDHNFFINEDEKLRDISINSNTKSYFCGDISDKNNRTTIEKTIGDMIAWLSNDQNNKNDLIYRFDIEKNSISNIYPQCVP